MTELQDIIGQIPMDQIAGLLGTDEPTARAAVEAAVPTLLAGMHNNAQAPDGAASLRIGPRPAPGWTDRRRRRRRSGGHGRRRKDRQPRLRRPAGPGGQPARRDRTTGRRRKRPGPETAAHPGADRHVLSGEESSSAEARRGPVPRREPALRPIPARAAEWTSAASWAGSSVEWSVARAGGPRDREAGWNKRDKAASAAWAISLAACSGRSRRFAPGLVTDDGTARYLPSSSLRWLSRTALMPPVPPVQQHGDKDERDVDCGQVLANHAADRCP